MATYKVTAPDGHTYTINGPEGASDRDIAAAVAQKYPYSAYTSKQLEDIESAPTKAGDVMRSLGSSLIEGPKSLTNLFGATNPVSEYLSEKQRSLLEGLSPERQQEQRIDQELIERAKGTGILNELSANLKPVARRPIESSVSGLFSSAPFLLAPEGALASKGLGALVGGKEILGSLMGIGSQKEQNYQDVLNKAIEEGKSPEEAKRLAETAAEYSLQNAPGLLLSAGTGALEGKLGAAAKLGTALRGATKEAETFRNVAKPSFGRTLGIGALESGGEEFLQGAGAQLGSNIALSQAGFNTPLFEGAVGAGAHDALIGALTGAAVSPMQLSTLKREYDADQAKKLSDENKAKQEQQAKTEAEFQKNFGVQLALPAPAKEIQEKPTDLLQNPLGNFTAEELGEDRVKAIDAHREAAGKPRLNTYSIEDVVDAMPKENPEAERAALNELVANKANQTMGGYSNQKVSAQDVLNAATQKGIDTNTQGFKDFLTRATGLPSVGVDERAETATKGKPLGLSELDMMTDAQRFVAQQALLKLPSKEGETTILPKGTNATHYDQGQYLSAIGAVDELHKNGQPATKEQALAEIKKSAGLNRDQDAEYLLRDAVRRGDFDLNEKGEIIPAETATYLPEGHAIEEATVAEGQAPEHYEVKAGDKVLSTADTEEEANRKLESYQEIRAKRAERIDEEITKKQEKVAKSREDLDTMEAMGEGRSFEYQKALADHSAFEAKTQKEIGDLNREKESLDPMIHPLQVKAGAIKPVKRKTFKLSKVKEAGKAAETLGSFPTRQAAEEAITSNMTETQLEELAKDTRRRTLARRARQELNVRRGNVIKVRTEFKEGTREIAKELESFLSKIGLKGVALKLLNTLDGSEGEYRSNLIQIALDTKNPLGVLRHESIHALRDLGFFSDNQWNALRRMAKDKWIKQFMKDVPFGEGMTRYDAYEQKYNKAPIAGVSFQDYIEEEAIADAFRYFHENGTPPGMIAAILKRLNQFFEAVRNALTNGGFYTAEDIFERIEKGELEPTKQGTAEAKASLKNTTKGLLNPNIPAKQEKILDDVIKEMDLTPEELASTSLIYQTGKPGTEQFESDKIGGLPEVVQFLQDQRRQSGLPLLNVDKPEDRKMIAKLMATEAMAAIRSGGANLEWYDSVINKTLAMAGLKYPELNTDINARTAFRIATAITSQGLNVEDNLGFAMKVYDSFRQNGRFPEIGQGADQSAMVNNFKLANYLLDDMGQDLMRQFLETEFTVEEMRSAGFDIKGELGDEKVLGSSVFGPKIGFGFYSNLNGNFDPVTMDMWFMRTIGRLTGNLKSFRQDLYNAQLQKFRDEFDTEGNNGVFANQFNQEELDLAKVDDKAAEALARKVKSAHERDYKNNRAGYDDKTRIKSPLVGASETMIKSLDAPRDAPSNGTERRNLRDVVRQMVDIVEEKYGKRVPPASLQAVIWYPEQELYKAMGVKLRVTSQNYAGAIEKILTGEGYDAGNLSTAAKLGSRTAQQLAKSAVAKGTQATGAQPVRLGALQAEEKEALLERGRKRIVLEQEKETPKRKRVVFEVAPDPNNKALTNKWRGLSTKQRIEISDKIGNKIIKDALAKFGLTGYVDTQVGSYGDDTNPSFALYLDSGDSVAVAKFLGYALSQDSMMVISPKEGKGLDKTGAVRVNVGEASADKVNDIYQKLREIEVNGEKPVGGQSFMNGHMVILNYSNLETSELAKLVNEKLDDQYDVITEDVYSAFPEKKDYDYANPSSDPRGNAGVLRQASRDLRSQATQLLQKELRGISPRLAEPPVRSSLRSNEGITLGNQQEGAVSYSGIHYGKEKTDVLKGDKYGTGLRGAERRRLEDHWDDRVKRRVYFYIPKTTGEMPTRESGLGGHVYTQKFNNILGPGKEMSRLMIEARENANEFESAIVDAGYDGYAVPNMGMMVVLNHDVPVNYEGTASEVSRASLKAPETPAFKQWFGDSKVVDSQGKPLIVYHGTNKDFSEFKYDLKKSIGIWSSPNPEIAGEYAGISARSGDAATVYPLYLSIQNPASRKDYLRTRKIAEEQSNKESRWADHDARHRQLLIDEGFDGIYLQGITQDPKDDVYIAFNPTQVKSATGNIGTFDATNPDIRYSLKAPNTPAFKRFFGDSKIVDKAGKPMVMYHSTFAFMKEGPEKGNLFTEFKLGADGKLGEGIYSTSIPEYAEKYAQDGAMMPLWVHIENPFEMNVGKDALRKERDGLYLTYEAGVSFKTQLDDKVKELTKGKKRLMDLDGDQVRALFEKNGYDGLMIKDPDGNIIEANAFTPTQLKSAIGNTGAYSISNPDIRYSIQSSKEFFKRADQIPESEGVAIIRENWIGGVSGIGDRDGVYDLHRVQGGPQYTKRVQDFIRKELGDTFKGYRLMSNDEYEELKTGAMGSQFVSFTFNPKVAEAFKNLPKYAKRKDLIVAEMDLTPEHVNMIGHTGEQEVVIDYGQGYNPQEIKEYTAPVRYSLAQLTKGMSNPAAFEQRLNTVVSRREDVGHARRMIDAVTPKSFSKFRREFLNRYDELSKVDKKLAKMRGVVKLMADASAEAAALLSDMASSLAAQALGVEGKGGVPVFKNGYTSIDKTKKGAVEIFAPLAKYGPEIYSLYQFWAGAKRGRRLFKEGREENYTADDFKHARELEQKYGTVFNSVQKDWLEYNNALVKYQVDTGVLSPERAAEYTKYSDYIPFYRQLDGQETVGPKLFQSMSGVKPTKALKGGEAPIADFLETIVRNTQAAIQSGTKNIAAQLAVKNSMEIGITEKKPVKAETFNTIRVFENGKEVFYHTHDKMLLESMQGLNLPQLPFLGFFAAPANFLRSMVTKDPGFMMANMMRDSIQAYVTSGADIVPFVDTVKHFGSAIAGKDPIIEKLKAAGLGGGHDFASDIQKSGRDLAKQIRKKAGAETKAERLFKPATSIWDFLEKSTEASDLATRAAIYEKTLAETGNEAEAIFQALEVLNFYRKGANPLIRIASAVIPFLNARIQGLDVFYRSGVAPSFAGTNPTEAEKMRQKVFFTRSAYVMALSCAYWALVHDDDDYKKQEQETKDNNWLIPQLGIKIPTPFEVGFLFKVIPERAMQYFFDNDTGKDFGEAITRGIKSTLQVQFPQIVQPAVEAATNFSFFTGRAIVPPGLENVAPEYQVGPSTSKTFESLGGALGESPMMLEHLWKGYTGTIGMYLVDVVDSVANMQSDSPKATKRFEQMPFIKRFALDPEARGAVSSYYDLKNSVDEAVRTENLLEKTGNYEALGEYMVDNAGLLANHDYILQMDKQMKELQQNASLVRNSSMDADTKRDILKAIGEAQNALTANVQYLKKLIRSQ